MYWNLNNTYHSSETVFDRQTDRQTTLETKSIIMSLRKLDFVAYRHQCIVLSALLNSSVGRCTIWIDTPYMLAYIDQQSRGPERQQEHQGVHIARSEFVCI